MGKIAPHNARVLRNIATKRQNAGYATLLQTAQYLPCPFTGQTHTWQVRHTIETIPTHDVGGDADSLSPVIASASAVSDTDEVRGNAGKTVQCAVNAVPWRIRLRWEDLQRKSSLLSICTHGAPPMRMYSYHIPPVGIVCINCNYYTILSGNVLILKTHEVP